MHYESSSIKNKESHIETSFRKNSINKKLGCRNLTNMGHRKKVNLSKKIDLCPTRWAHIGKSIFPRYCERYRICVSAKLTDQTFFSKLRRFFCIFVYRESDLATRRHAGVYSPVFSYFF